LARRSANTGSAMKVLIVRTEPGATLFAQQLEAPDIHAIPTPVTVIEPVHGDMASVAEAQAVLFTSVYAVDRFAAQCPRRDLPALTVGDATAAAAKAAGFSRIASAKADVRGLEALVLQHCRPESGPLLYPSARDVSGDLETRLARHDFSVERTILYAARAAEKLPDTADEALRTRTIDAAAFFSARNARLFATLAIKAGQGGAFAGMYALCISASVADALQEASGSANWQQVIVAKRPEADEIARAVRELAARISS